jgi:site-specific DNA-cytosine methylase
VADIAGDCLETWRVNHGTDHPQCALLEVDLSTDAGVQAVIEAAGSADLVVGGIPCEQVSCLRGHLKVSRDDMEQWFRLIDNCLLIVDRLKPRWWSIEDVIQIEKYLPPPLFHGKEIRRRRIDAKDFGPQSRIRTFIGEFPDPQPVAHNQTLRDCLLAMPHLMFTDAEKYTVNPDNSSRVGRDFVRILDPDNPCYTIIASGANRGGRQQRSFVVEEGSRRRILSWQEAALVQGFPRDYLFVGSMTRASEMIGRAIPIYVGHAILSACVKIEQLQQEEL